MVQWTLQNSAKKFFLGHPNGHVIMANETTNDWTSAFVVNKSVRWGGTHNACIDTSSSDKPPGDSFPTSSLKRFAHISLSAFSTSWLRPQIIQTFFFRGVASLSFLVMELLSCVNCNYLNNNNEAKMPIREIWARKEGAIWIKNINLLSHFFSLPQFTSSII